jgi:hypothetical protein
MTLVSKNIPNLINGVSQQPPALRLASQAEAQENGFSDIVDGLKKRPPTQFKNKLKKTNPTGTTFLSATEINRSHFHTYKRSTSEQYTVVTDPVVPKMYVYDIDGSLRYESGVASWNAAGTQIITNSDNTAIAAYLGTNAIDSTQVTATSVADYTFFVNKDKVVAKDTTTPSFVRPHEGMFYLKQADYKSEYNVFVKNSGGTEVSGNVETLSNADPINAKTLATSRIMEFLTNTTADGDTTDFNNEDGLFRAVNASALSGISRNYTDKSPFCVLESTSTTFDMRSSDDQGDTNLFTHKDTTSSFISLPKTCKDNFVIQVNGDNQKKEDDFYVQFSGTGNQGTWKECAAPSRPNTPVYHTFDTTTMPHTLSQNADLSFTFNSSTWDERKCGDEDTNPFPSFVGSKINDVFFHRNRLGFLADENVIFSEASSYFNFFRVTVRSLLDTAPIDLAVSQNEVSILKAAVPAQDDLILFSDLTQFTLSADSLLTPSEVIVDQSTKYECDLTSTPVGAGTSVFFTTKSGDYSGVREFFTKDDSENKDAPSITSHVPEYLNGTVRQMIASSNEDMLVCLTETNKKECYVYKWYNSSQERIQSSWSKWVFDTDIAHIFFNNAQLTVIFSDGNFEEVSLATTDTNITYSEANSFSSTVSLGTATQDFGGVSHTLKGLNTITGAVAIVGTTSNSDIDAAYVFKNNVANTYGIYVQIGLLSVTGGVTVPATAAQLPTSLTVGGQTIPISTWASSGSAASPQIFTTLVITEQNYNDWFNSGTTLVVNIAETSVETSAKSKDVLLDHRVKVTQLEGDSEFNTVDLDAQFTSTATSQYVNHKGDVVAIGNSSDEKAKVVSFINNKQHKENGVLVNNYVIAGEPYTFKYKLSEQVFKAGDSDPTRMARYQLRSMLLNYNDTGSFAVTVSSTGRDDKVTNFTGRILGQANNILGYSPVVEDGTLKVGIQSQAQETDITITNATHLPSTFQNAEVEAFVTLRNKRM